MGPRLGVYLKFRTIQMGVKEPTPPGFHQQMFVGPLKTGLPEPPQRIHGKTHLERIWTWLIPLFPHKHDMKQLV